VSRPYARSLHGLVATMVAVGVALEVITAFVDGPGIAGSMTERLVRLFSYFTIQSNILIGVTSAMLAIRPDRDGRVFRVARIDGLLCIAVTGIVYHVALSGLHDLTPAGALSNFLLHTAVPLVAVVAWVVVGPRPRIDVATVWWSAAYPLAWIAYTFVRGAVTGWYPYPFLDVSIVGYVTAAVNTAIVAVVFLALASALHLLERRLDQARAGRERRSVTS
jgi:hypothetical protein